MSSTILFLGLPRKTFVGVNLSSFSSSPQFYGITNVPAGLNLIYTGTDVSLSIRHGIWLSTSLSHSGSQAETHVLRWSSGHEHLVLLPQNDEDAQRVSRDLPELQTRGLVDYVALCERTASLQQEQTTGRESRRSDGEESVESWSALTSHITPRLLSRLLRSTETWTLTSLASTQQDAEAERIPGLSQSEASSTISSHVTLSLASINLKQTWPDSALGRERTDKARDRSWYLGHLIQSLTAPVEKTETGKPADKQISQQQAASELLGELQFCFISVLTLANWSCFEQWKRLLSVFFTCKSALVEVEGFFIEVVRVLRIQLGRVDDVEGGLFEMADDQATSWLRQLLRVFRVNVDEVGAQKIKSVLKELEEWLQGQYGWEDERNVLRRGKMQLEDGEEVELEDRRYDGEDELGEYAPVVVEMG